MKINIILCSVMISLALLLGGCGGQNRELKKDARNFADAMCRNIETMQKIRKASPADTLLMQKLQKEHQAEETEMTTLSVDFRKKYGEKINIPEFNRQYRKYLNEAMLDCRFLSKEDRENFEKEVK